MGWGELFRKTAVAPDFNSSRYGWWNGQLGNLSQAGQWKRDIIDSRFPKGVGGLPWEWGNEVARDRNRWYDDSAAYQKLDSDWKARGQSEKATADETEAYQKELRNASLASYFGGSGIGSAGSGGDSGYYSSKNAFGNQASQQAMQNNWLEENVAKMKSGGLIYNAY